MGRTCDKFLTDCERKVLLGLYQAANFDIQQKPILRKSVYNLLFKYKLYLYVDQID